MVGDTAYDVEGARKIGIDCVGVTYGYGKETELAAAHPLGLAATVEALQGRSFDPCLWLMTAGS